MGNCLLLQENVIKIMKTDGKILEYNNPVEAYHVLSDFPGHAISDSLPVSHHLQPETKLLSGHLYYLVPLSLPPQNVSKKVRFSTLDAEAEEQKSGGVMRIKLVITKRELQELLQNEKISVTEMISQIQGGKNMNMRDTFDDYRDCKGWKPVLESIPEID